MSVLGAHQFKLIFFPDQLLFFDLRTVLRSNLTHPLSPEDPTHMSGEQDSCVLPVYVCGVHVYASVCNRVHICLHILKEHTRMCACMDVCSGVHTIHTSVCACTWTYGCVHTYIYMWVQACTCL